MAGVWYHEPQQDHVKWLSDKLPIIWSRPERYPVADSRGLIFAYYRCIRLRLATVFHSIMVPASSWLHGIYFIEGWGLYGKWINKLADDC